MDRVNGKVITTVPIGSELDANAFDRATQLAFASGRRQRINVISAINGRGEFWAATYDGKLDAHTFVAFLKDFLKSQGGKIFLVLDELAVHHAPPVRRIWRVWLAAWSYTSCHPTVRI